MHAVCLLLLEAREGITASANETIGWCEPLCGYWESNSGSPEEQQVLLITSPTPISNILSQQQKLSLQRCEKQWKWEDEIENQQRLKWAVRENGGITEQWSGDSLFTGEFLSRRRHTTYESPGVWSGSLNSSGKRQPSYLARPQFVHVYFKEKVKKNPDSSTTLADSDISL